MHVKPIVFLSHSSRDAEAIKRLKRSLLSVTHETMIFFLSCDGDSITAGRSWVDQTFSSLSNASIVFTFLSPTSLQSQWLFFEAGMAHCRNIPVVPVGISGVKVGEIPPPLGLFEGFDLDSAQSFEQMIDILNKRFSHKHPVQSSSKEFNSFIGQPVAELKDGNYNFRVFSKSQDGEKEHENVNIKINQSRMNVCTASWESVGIITGNRFVGRFKYLDRSSPEYVGLHDFTWNGNEFIGSARADNGAWHTESLFWRP